MHPTRLAALAALFFLWLPAQGRAQGISPHDQPFQARIGGIFFDLDTSVRVDGRTSRGSTLELEDDLDLPALPVVPFFELSYGLVFRLNLSVLQSIRDGEERIDQSVAFNGARMAYAGDDMSMRSELLTADLFLSTAIYRTRGITIDLITGAKYVHLKHRLRNKDPQVTVGLDRLRSTDTVDVPGLYYGLGGRMPLSPTLTMYTRFLFTQYAWDAFDTERFFFTDFVVGLTYLLWPRLSISVDYRLLRLEVAEDNSGHLTVYDLFANGVGLSAMWAY